MQSIYSEKAELLSASGVREILRSTGPCITILLPPYRPGEPAGSHAGILKSDIREADRQLAECGYANPARASLLKSLQRYAEDPILAAGAHWGEVIFCAPNRFHRFALTQPVQHSLTVGGCFALRKVAKELRMPQSVYVLALSKTGVSLMHCAGLQAEIVSLPAGVPKTLAEALALEPPDHDLENRSAAGVSLGAMQSVRFGTGSGRESQKDHLADYYRMVDRGLRSMFRDRGEPLILAGVDEDTAIYQGISTYAGLLNNTISSGHDFSRDQADVLRHAFAILNAESDKRDCASMEIALERAIPGHFFTDPEMVLGAAFEGRVHQVYINADAQHVGVYQRDTYQSWGKEDLLNVAAVQTVVHGGEYREIPGDCFPNGGTAIGILRY